MATLKYDTQGVFVGPPNPTGNLTSGDIEQLNRIQSTSYAIEIQRENVMGLGTAAANDQVKDAPFVNLSLEYLVTDGRNEKNLSFVVDGIHGSLLRQNSGERDFFVLINKPNETPMVLAIGNGLMTKFSVNGQVNSFLKASADIRGFNIKLDEGTSGNYIPRVNVKGIPNSSYTYQLPPIINDVPERTVGGIEDNIYIGPGNIHMAIPNNSAFGMLFSGNNSKTFLQSFNFSLGLERGEMTQLGERYPFKRCLQLPMELTLSTSFFIENFVADNIQNYFCQTEYDIDIDIKHSACTNIDKFWDTETNKTKLKYMFRGMKLKNFSSSDSIDDRKNVTVEWSVPIGNILDLERNLFISGDFGRYLFPVDSFRDVTGEAGITGYGLQPMVREVVYRRSKVDVEEPEFEFGMTGKFDSYYTDPSGFIYYQGDSGFLPNAQALNSDITEEDFLWRSDSYSTVFDRTPTSGTSKKFSTFAPEYIVGYPGLSDHPTGSRYCYFKGYGFNTEPVEIKFAGKPDWLDVVAEFPKFQIDPYKPYYFNKLGLTVNEVDIPTGYAFDFQMIARNSKFQKIYDIHVETPYSFHITLPEAYSRRTSVWLQPYDERRVFVSGDDTLFNITDSSLRGTLFSGYNNSGYLPAYMHKAQNDKSYISFNSGSYLNYTVASGASGWSGFSQDFKNFTFFAVYRPHSSSESGASLLTFNSAQSGNKVFFGRKALSEDLEFYYTNPTGLTSTHLNLVNGYVYDVWNVVAITYDGVRASGWRSGELIESANIPGPSISQFTSINIASGDMHGDVAEIILMPYRLTEPEINHINSLLIYKWGIV